MNHPTEIQLNEYLDGELEAVARRSLEAHLAGCPACRQALDELRRLEARLDTLPEEPLLADLSARVLERLPRRRTALAWKLTLAAQAGFGLGLFLLLAEELLPRLELQRLWALLPWSLPVLSFPEIALPAPALPAIPLQPSTLQLAFLAASTLLLWAVGNALLLRNGNKVPHET
jgi:anti-sigma factor RsiW